MEHSQALETNAPDRYVLGLLSAAEADAFEEHYFDCEACAEEVRLGMSIMEGGRLLVQQEAEAPAATPPAPEAPVVVPIDSRGKWGRWIAAAAVAAVMAIPVNFALLMRMQNVVPRVVQVVAAPNPADALVTADPISDAVVRSTPGERLVITDDSATVNVPPDLSDPPLQTYKVQIFDAAGKVVSERQYPRQLMDAKQLVIDARVLNNGVYRLSIIGIGPAGRTSIVNRPFTVRRATKGAYQQRGARRERWNSHTTPAPVLQAA